MLQHGQRLLRVVGQLGGHLEHLTPVPGVFADGLGGPALRVLWGVICIVHFALSWFECSMFVLKDYFPIIGKSTCCGPGGPSRQFAAESALRDPFHVSVITQNMYYSAI